MPVAEADPFADLAPPDDLIGGLGDAPAYQTTGGRFQEVPRAQLNAPAAVETDPFADLQGNVLEQDGLLDVGEFHDLVPQPPKPQTATEQALIETPEWVRSLRQAAGTSGIVHPPTPERTGPDPNDPQPAGPWSTTLTGIGLPRPFPDKGEGTVEQLANAVFNFPVSAIDFALSPAGVVMGTITPALSVPLKKLVAAGFTIDQIRHAATAPDLQSRTEALLGAALATGAFLKIEPKAETPKSAPVRPASESNPVDPAIPAKVQSAATQEVESVRTTQEASKGEIPSPASPDNAPLSADYPPNPQTTIETPILDPLKQASSLPGDKTPSEIVQPSRVPQPEVTLESVANARQIEPVIPKEPAGTKFAEPVSDANAKAAETVPENLRRNPEIDRLINEPEAQVAGQMKFEPATEGGALGFGGGKRATVTAKGTTPRGDTEFLKIEPGPKRILKGLEREGAADIIGRSKNKVGKLLSEATDRHVDLEQELTGKLSSEFERAHKGMSRSKLDKAYDEIAVYEAAQQNSRPTIPLSKDAKKLVTAWENVAESTGKIMAANDVQVRDPATGNYRPTSIMGRTYRPRMFKPEVERVMRDPDSNVTLFNELVSEVQKHHGISEAEASNYLRAEAGRFTSSGFMGAIDMARTAKLPEVFYEYDLRNLAARYIPAFSERMAQIIAYGQRLGPKEQPVRKNLWDIAREEAGDVKTKELLNVIEDQSINLRPTTFGARAMSGAQTTATGLYLSAPTTTLRNLISGLTATPELLGTRRSAQALGRIIKNRQVFADAREIGVIRDSIATTLHADKLSDSFVHDVIRSTTDKALKYSLHSGSEAFVRTHGFVTADIFARDAVKALNKRSTSMRSKEALGLFKRMGADAQKIVAEKGEWRTGPETRKFIRTFVRETQGGYRFNQVPLWANSNNGRFLYQFGRWGAMKSRNIVRNGIRPAIGEDIKWQGKTMSRRDLRPLLKMAVTPVLLGETFAGLSQLLYGRDRRDASLSEISEAWEEDKKLALMMAGERIANDIIMAGTLGIWSTPLDWAKSFKDQSRLKNPTAPPGLGSITALKDLGQKALDQNGDVTRRDVIDFLSSFTPGIKQGHDIQRNIRDEPLYEAENDVKTLRAAALRWGKRTGLDVSPRGKGEFRKSALAPEYEPIKEALLVGNSERATFLTKAFLEKQPDRAKAKKNLKMSIRMSQPFRAGPYNAKKYRDEFKEWAQKNLNKQDWQQTERIQERYMKSATKLWESLDND